MKQRGRKSAEGLATVADVSGLVQRPPPPGELTEAQAVEWRSIVAKMPPGWFTRETHPLLVEYVRHITRARTLAAELDRFEVEWLREDDGPGRFDRLAKAGERESRALLALTRSLRLTHQARVDPKSAGRRLGDRKQSPPPWGQEKSG